MPCDQLQTRLLEMSASLVQEEQKIAHAEEMASTKRSEWDVACIIVKQTSVFHGQFVDPVTLGSTL